MFKVGDWVIRTGDKGYFEHVEYRDIPYQIKEITQTQQLRIDGSGRSFIPRHFSLVPKATKLNKRLYPTYVEHNGFLLPPDLRTRIIEQEQKTP